MASCTVLLKLGSCKKQAVVENGMALGLGLKDDLIVVLAAVYAI